MKKVVDTCNLKFITTVSIEANKEIKVEDLLKSISLAARSVHPDYEVSGITCKFSGMS